MAYSHRLHRCGHVRARRYNVDMTDNPLLISSGLPQFSAIRPGHVEPAIRQTIAEQRAELAALEAQPAPSFASLVVPLEEMRHRLARVWSPVSHLNAVRNSDELRAAYNTCLPLLSDFQTDVAQSAALCAGYQRIQANEGATLDDTQRELVAKALRDFHLSGVDLAPEPKARFKAVMMELSQLGAKFEENVLDATNTWRHHVTDPAEVQGVNASILEQAAQQARERQLPGWLFTLDQPSYVAVMTDGASAGLRRTFYEAWNTRASDCGPSAGRFDNGPVMEQILKLRHEAARLLQFSNFAELALADRMATSVAEVTGFLRQLASAARAAARQEFAELELFAARPLQSWDVSFYSERLQQKLFSISQEELREYLPLPRVLAGLFEVIGRLYGLGFEPRANVDRWHPDVQYFDVRAPDGTVVAGFFLDPYARPHKRSGAWMDDCVGRKQLDGTLTLPVAHLTCNSLPPGNGKPALLTHDDVVTLFHEFGHGLHHMLTRVGYPSVAGISGVAWDAVELPSQFMENYAWLPEVLQKISAFGGDGAPLPADTQQRLIATRSFQAGMQTVRQVELALFDMRLHAEYDPARGGRIYEILDEVRQEVAVLQPPAWQRFPHNFGHVFAGGYAAGYYSYKWAEVLAADAFAAFTEHGPFDRATATRFLDSILARGGSRDALANFVEFRGRKPEIQALLQLYGIAA
jgi:oligopeptidase A